MGLARPVARHPRSECHARSRPGVPGSVVQLFVQRAQAVKSDFAVTSRNAVVVSAICAQLVGLPLAIEVATAWVRARGVDQILERMDGAFELLVGGSRSS